MKGDPMGFEQVWKNESSGDNVSMDEERALVRLERAPVCSSHPEDVYCPFCLPRLVKALDVIRRILDPKADAEISNQLKERSGPEYIALHSPTVDTAYVMRFHSASKVSAQKSLFTGTTSREEFKSITLAEHKTQVQVCDAHYIKSFSVRIKRGGNEPYLRELGNAFLTFEVDGEPLVRKVTLKDALRQQEIALPRYRDPSILFCAVALKEGEADVTNWLGYMLPNHTEIKVTLENIPSGGGLLQIETAWDLELYTTKTETGKGKLRRISTE